MRKCSIKEIKRESIKQNRHKAKIKTEKELIPSLIFNIAQQFCILNSQKIIIPKHKLNIFSVSLYQKLLNMALLFIFFCVSCHFRNLAIMDLRNCTLQLLAERRTYTIPPIIYYSPYFFFPLFFNMSVECLISGIIFDGYSFTMITPVSSPSIIPCFLSSKLANIGVLQVKLIMRITLIVEMGGNTDCQTS